MSFRLVCTLGFIGAGIFGLGFLLIPELVFSYYGITGWNPGTTLIARLYGVGLLYAASASFAARESTDPRLQRAFGMTFAVVSALGAIASLLSVLSGGSNALMWSTVAIFGFYAIVFFLAGWRARRR